MDKAWQKKLFAWYETPLGQSYLKHEKKLQKKLIASQFAMTLLRCGESPGCSVKIPILEEDSVIHQLDVFGEDSIGLIHPENNNVIFADMMHLPVQTGTIDLVLAQHCLEFSKYPHNLLRELHRILAPEGTLMLTAFNPLSIWGLIKLLGQHFNKAPWLGRFYTFNRIEDWLLLLGFAEIKRLGFCYRLPIPHKKIYTSMYPLDKLEDVSWLNFGAGMIITAKKRVVTGIPITYKPIIAEAMPEVCYSPHQKG